MGDPGKYCSFCRTQCDETGKCGCIWGFSDNWVEQVRSTKCGNCRKRRDQHDSYRYHETCTEWPPFYKGFELKISGCDAFTLEKRRHWIVPLLFVLGLIGVITGLAIALGHVWRW